MNFNNFEIIQVNILKFHRSEVKWVKTRGRKRESMFTAFDSALHFTSPSHVSSIIIKQMFCHMAYSKIYATNNFP